MNKLNSVTLFVGFILLTSLLAAAILMAPNGAVEVAGEKFPKDSPIPGYFGQAISGSGLPNGNGINGKFPWSVEIAAVDLTFMADGQEAVAGKAWPNS